MEVYKTKTWNQDKRNNKFTSVTTQGVTMAVDKFNRCVLMWLKSDKYFF